MLNFTYHNPTAIVFGRGSIAQLTQLIPATARVLLTYGGGSIKQNGVYEQVILQQSACISAILDPRS